jgi:hypothetical protein
MTDKINKLDLLIMEEVGLVQEFNVGDIEDTAVVVAAAVVADGIIRLAYRGYHRWMSDAGRACAGKSFKDRTACVNEHRRKANEAYLDGIKKELPKCKKSNDPSLCMKEVKQRMHKLTKIEYTTHKA